MLMRPDGLRSPESASTGELPFCMMPATTRAGTAFAAKTGTGVSGVQHLLDRRTCMAGPRGGQGDWGTLTLRQKRLSCRIEVIIIRKPLQQRLGGGGGRRGGKARPARFKKRQEERQAASKQGTSTKWAGCLKL